MKGKAMQTLDWETYQATYHRERGKHGWSDVAYMSRDVVSEVMRRAAHTTAERPLFNAAIAAIHDEACDVEHDTREDYRECRSSFAYQARALVQAIRAAMREVER